MQPKSKTAICFEKFDLFGIKPSLYFKGRTKSGTNFGVCLSFFLIAFTSLCFGFFGQDLYYRKNPQLRYNEAYDPFPNGITIDPEVSPVLIELNSPMVDMFYTNSSLVNVNVSQFSIRKTDNGTFVTMENYRMETCRSDHLTKLDEKTRNYFLSMNLNDFFCIPKDLKNLTMIGAFDQNVFQTIKFTVSMCNNLTHDGKCLSSEEIKQTMSRGFVGIYFVDYNINPSNYENPKESQPKEVFTNFMINSQKEIDIYMRNNYIETDDGVIFQSVNTEIVNNFDHSTEMDFRLEDPDFLLIYFKIKQGNSYYRRTYRKFQEILAQIGGFINCFLIIMSATNYLHSHLTIICEIIQNVFTIKLFNEKDPTGHNTPNKQNFMGNEAQISKLDDIPPSGKKSSGTFRSFGDSGKKKSDLFHEGFSKKKGEYFEHSDSEMILQNYDNLRLDGLDYLYYYTGLFKTPEREKKKFIIKEGARILQTCLDIKYIIQKFYELEKLKQMVLSAEDLRKFAHLPKPELKISFNEHGKKRNNSKAVITTLIQRSGSVDRAQVLPKSRLVKINA